MAFTKLSNEEVVVRMLLRTKQEMKSSHPKFRGPHDENDYLRQRELRSTGQPESGLSLIRRKIKKTSEEIYACIKTSAAKGIADCVVQKLRDNGFDVIIDLPEQDYHASLRCMDCDMADVISNALFCRVRTSSQECPLFRNGDVFLDLFERCEEPQFRY